MVLRLLRHFIPIVHRVRYSICHRIAVQRGPRAPPLAGPRIRALRRGACSVRSAGWLALASVSPIFQLRALPAGGPRHPYSPLTAWLLTA